MQVLNKLGPASSKYTLKMFANRLCYEHGVLKGQSASNWRRNKVSHRSSGLKDLTTVLTGRDNHGPLGPGLGKAARGNFRTLRKTGEMEVDLSEFDFLI